MFIFFEYTPSYFNLKKIVLYRCKDQAKGLGQIYFVLVLTLRCWFAINDLFRDGMTSHGHRSLRECREPIVHYSIANERRFGPNGMFVFNHVYCTFIFAPMFFCHILLYIKEM